MVERRTLGAGRVLGCAIAAAATVLLTASAAWANPSQADVFRSIQDSVDHQGSISGTQMMAVLAVVVAVVLVAVVIHARQARQQRAARPGTWRTVSAAASHRPGTVNHPGKLVRELMRETGLTRGQVRQLEAINQRLAADDHGVEHLATLLLCPSLLASASRDEAA